MHDAGKIIFGLIIFLALITFPFWFTLASGKAGYRPNPELPEGNCVESKAYMKAWHMDLLNEWRDEVVRSRDRVYVTADGRRYEKSLTRTCLGCHQSKANSCDRCHDYLDVQPYCWECHVDPKGVLR